MINDGGSLDSTNACVACGGGGRTLVVFHQ